MARRIDLRRGHMSGLRGQAPTTQMGIRGCCTGRGQEGDLAEAEVVALEGERLAAPEPFEDGERLVEHGRARAAIELVAAEPGALVRGRAEADGESEAASGEPVEGGGLPRDQPGTVPGEGRQHGAKADALGADGDRGEQHPGIGEVRRELARPERRRRACPRGRRHPSPPPPRRRRTGSGFRDRHRSRRWEGSHRSASRECTLAFSTTIAIDSASR